MYFLNIDEKHHDENYLRQQYYTSDHTGVLRSMDVLAKKSLSENRLLEEELTILDRPIIRNNYRRLYANVMQNGSSSWKALDYLNKLKQKEIGFDFRMRFNEESLPIGIV